MICTRESLLSLTRQTKTIELPATGSVLVKELTAAQVVEFSKRQAKDNAEAIYYLIVAGAYDESGNQIFQDSDIDQLKNMGASISNAIVQGVMEISGMTPPTPDKGTAEKKDS